MKKTTILVLLLCAAVLVSGCITGDAKGGKGGSGAPAAQCGDGIDNDGDGFCDTDHKRTKCTDGSTPGDVDCSSSDDDSEAPDCSIACEIASDCGTDGTTGTPYCQDGNVYQDSQAFTCSNSGTCDAACSSETTSALIETCSNGCTNGVCNVEDNSSNGNSTNSTG